MSDRHIVVNVDGYNKLVAERDILAAELAEAQTRLKKLDDDLDLATHNMWRQDELDAIKYRAAIESCRLGWCEHAAELAEANRKLAAWQRYDDEEVKPERDAGNAAIYKLNVALAEAEHSRDEWRKIAENRRVDGMKALDEVDRLKAHIAEMIELRKEGPL